MSQDIVNLSYLVESSLNDEEYVKMMIDMYIKNTPEYLSKFKTLQEQNDLDELKRLAHKFKASVTIMGIESATVIIETLEKNISENKDLGKIPEMITELASICTDSLEVLQVVVDSKEPICK